MIGIVRVNNKPVMKKLIPTVNAIFLRWLVSPYLEAEPLLLALGGLNRAVRPPGADGNPTGVTNRCLEERQRHIFVRRMHPPLHLRLLGPGAVRTAEIKIAHYPQSLRKGDGLSE